MLRRFVAISACCYLIMGVAATWAISGNDPWKEGEVVSLGPPARIALDNPHPGGIGGKSEGPWTTMFLGSYCATDPQIPAHAMLSTTQGIDIMINPYSSMAKCEEVRATLQSHVSGSACLPIDPCEKSPQ